MKISYNWLETYFEEKLPSPEKLADLLTFHVFEIESVEAFTPATSKITDTVFDVKVLPDRARYALAHRGVAYEVSAITGLKKKPLPLIKTPVTSSKKVIVINDESEACPRYSARYVEGVKVGPAPAWLRERLEAVGQRSINNIVDAANYVMLDLEQPLHAFDADKVSGSISVRKAKKDEKITTLDGKEVALDESVLVIADEEGPLAIAGIKGGNRAAVTESTKNIIIESANFNASLIRKTTQKIGIRSDSSKRYENEISPDLTMMGMEWVTQVIADIAEAAAVGEITDMYPNPQKPWTVNVSAHFITDLLGTVISEKEIEEIFDRLHISFKKQGDEYALTPPFYRLDLQIPEDIVEEVGRIHGYEKISPVELPKTSFIPSANKAFQYYEQIRAVLIAAGFSEVYTYSLQNKGDIGILNPLASDKNFLRKNLTSGVTEALELNAKNDDLLGLDQIKIFEIGKIFTAKGEVTSLCIGVKNAKKLKIKEADAVSEALTKIAVLQGAALPASGSVVEIVLDEIIQKLPEPAGAEKAARIPVSSGIKFKPISPYPFAVRDIAVFMPAPADTKSGEDEIRTIIEKQSGALLVRNTLFDTFKKEIDGTPKVSYAFRLVFQSAERTLTEAEINDIMQKITAVLNANPGWQVR